MSRLVFSGLALVASTSVAFADPGHGAGAGIIHFLTEPDHLAILVGALAIGAVLFRRVKRAR
jgi:hydrogenase/urease accessory protein HupE